MTNISYGKAVNLALLEAMSEDERVFCLGEDVGYGGAYGATKGLRDKFGAARVRDTPISETAIVGFGVGAAVTGLRPVAEIMHMDFVTCAMDQVVNQAAKMRFMFGGKATVPMSFGPGWEAGSTRLPNTHNPWSPGSPIFLESRSPRRVRRLISVPFCWPRSVTTTRS